MPIYEYKCNKCRHTFEILHKISEKPLEICKKCGDTLTRVFHPVGLIFKGSGFYTTDYSRTCSGEESLNTGKPQAESSNPKTPDTCQDCDKSCTAEN